MKKIVSLAIVLFSISINSFSLSDKEKYDLFYSATDIVVITNFPNIEDVEFQKEVDAYMKRVTYTWDSLWTGNTKAKIRCFNNPCMGFENLIKKSNKVFKETDITNTLFVNLYRDINQIYYLNDKKELELLSNSFQPPLSIFSNQKEPVSSDFYPVMMSLNNLKSKIDLLKLPKMERAQIEEKNRSLKQLKNETIFFHSNLFDNSKHLSIEDFKNGYKYKLKISSLTSSNEPFLFLTSDSLNELMNDSTIRFVVYSYKVSGYYATSMSSANPIYINSNRNIYIYDKINGTINFINFLTTPSFITKKNLRKLLKNIEK